MTVQQISPIRRLAEHSAVRFLVVGGLSVATNTGALYLLHGVADIWLPVAAALAFAISFVVNFVLNRVWTFGSGTGTLVGHLWRYLSLVLVNLGLNAVLVPAVTWLGVPYLISQVLVTAVLSVANYVVSRKWIFT